MGAKFHLHSFSASSQESCHSRMTALVLENCRPDYVPPPNDMMAADRTARNDPHLSVICPTAKPQCYSQDGRPQSRQENVGGCQSHCCYPALQVVWPHPDTHGRNRLPLVPVNARTGRHVPSTRPSPLRLVSTPQAVAEGTQNGPWRTSLSVEHVFGPSGLSFQSSRGTAADASPFVAQQVGNRTRAGAVITDSGSCTQDGIGRRFRRAGYRKEAIGCCDRQRFLFSHTGAECQ
jgi:hypothetical protein